jgi:hypothetical protein
MTDIDINIDGQGGEDIIIIIIMTSICNSATIDGNPKDTCTSKEQFLALPYDQPMYCRLVDTVSGLWIFCKLCEKKLPVRDHRPFTIGRWNSHKKVVAKKHDSLLAALRTKNLAARIQKANEGSLTEREKSRLKIDSKVQKPLKSFFCDPEKLVGICNLEGGSNTGLNAQTILRLSAIRLVPSLSAIGSVSSEKKCQGIFQDFQGNIQNKVAAYCRYAAMNTGYVSGLVWGFLQIFGKQCSGTAVSLVMTKSKNNVEFQQIWQCAECA